MTPTEALLEVIETIQSIFGEAAASPIVNSILEHAVDVGIISHVEVSVAMGLEARALDIAMVTGVTRGHANALVRHCIAQGISHGWFLEYLIQGGVVPAVPEDVTHA